jgi:hypothetical protein
MDPGVIAPEVSHRLAVAMSREPLLTDPDRHEIQAVARGADWASWADVPVWLQRMVTRAERA